MSDKHDFNKIVKIKDNMKNMLNISDKTDENQLKEKEFYKEIDKKKNKNCCSLPLIILFLIFIFIGLIIFMFYIKNYTKSGIDLIVENRKINQVTLSDSFISKTEKIKIGETVNVDFSEIEVSNYLGVADSDFPLKRARLTIDNKGIIITGRTSDNALSLPIKTVVRPKIEQQKLIFFLDELATGAVSVPSNIKNNVNNYLLMIMKSRELYDQNLEIISASTSEGKLTLEINRKM